MSQLAFSWLPDVPDWFAWLKVVKLVLVITFLALVVIGKVQSSRRGHGTAGEDGV